jgi:hypothetical protein|tara:strand:- start:726 stop:932 length:207 start_codon:yes stop_codon:yes gene_type:complete
MQKFDKNLNLIAKSMVQNQKAINELRAGNISNAESLMMQSQSILRIGMLDIDTNAKKAILDIVMEQRL